MVDNCFFLCYNSRMKNIEAEQHRATIRKIDVIIGAKKPNRKERGKENESEETQIYLKYDVYCPVCGTDCCMQLDFLPH